MSKRTQKSKHQPRPARDREAKPGQHITKISAGSSRREAPATRPENPPKGQSQDRPETELVVTDTGQTVATPVDRADAELNTPKKLTRAEKRALKRDRQSDEERPIKSYFLPVRPFVALGRYLRDSWREIRQVRWPNRKATWKMTLAVLVYCALFMIFLTLIDVFFTFLFKLVFKTE